MDLRAQNGGFAPTLKRTRGADGYRQSHGRVRATFPHYRVPNPKGARSSTLWIQARYVKLAGRRTFGVGKA
jgi:hypothetical protein